MPIKFDVLKDSVERAGLQVEELGTYWKVSAGDNCLYIAKTQRVGRVDVSGFTFEHPALRQVSAEDAKRQRIGRVRAQVDFSRPDDEALEAFETALELMKHLAGMPARLTRDLRKQFPRKSRPPADREKRAS